MSNLKNHQTFKIDKKDSGCKCTSLQKPIFGIFREWGEVRKNLGWVGTVSEAILLLEIICKTWPISYTVD